MSNYLKCILILTINLLIVTSIQAWDTEQLEVFDLVEEINENFYNILNITQDADLQAIKKAFRGQSLILHPDKNDAPDAEVKFRNLVSVYEVLRDPEKRAHYDDVLKNGLPNWKSAVYYYRHVRKMGLLETLTTLFILISIGQYLVAWGAYVEKKYTAEQVYRPKIKKQQKRRGVNVNTDISAELIEKLDIKKPSFQNTLPIQIPKVVWFAIKEAGPATIRLVSWMNEQRKVHLNRKAQEEEDSSEDETLEQQRIRPARKRKPAFVPMERDASDLPPRLVHVQQTESGAAPVLVTGGLWTDDDLAELVQLVKKFPGGTTDRWEKIAEAMNRTVSEVTYMANKLKDNLYRIPGQEEDNPPDYEIPKKKKTRGGKLGAVTITTASNDTNENSNSGIATWTQLQQKALESALAKHPKGPTDRWDKIAKCVPDKTKEECILRYKYLVELVKKQKEKKEINEAEE